MVQFIFIIGATGKVGSALVTQILEKRDGDFRLHHNPTRIVGLASHDKYIFSKDGLSKKECLGFIQRKEASKPYQMVEDLLVKVKEAGYGFERKLIFIDTTAATNITNFHLQICEERLFGMVTANKNPLALCDFSTFQRLTRDVRSYGYRCSVMAGAEAVSLLQDLRDVQDPPLFLFGCFSGTLGLVCTELEKGRRFSEIIREAKEKGYTEPHPRDDFNGLDVARKLLILARTAGYPVNMEDLSIQPFIPKKYLQEEDVGKFMDSLKGLDDNFSALSKKAKEKGDVLRYVAQMNAENGCARLLVSLQEVPKSSTLGMLSGTANKITVISKTYPKEKPYIVEAPGAGLEITAQNIRRNLLNSLEGRKSFSVVSDYL